jgi:hypothetical protein
MYAGAFAKGSEKGEVVEVVEAMLMMGWEVDE